MRTNIDIDDKLMQTVLESGYRTKKAAVEAGLRLLVQVQQQAAIRGLRGTVEWSGNLEESRQGHQAE